jgi:cytochrome o ubiquinol oxidase subunit 2
MTGAVAHERRLGALRAGVTILICLLAGGCSLANAPILDPKGPIALAERDILFRAFAIMMVVVIPVFVMAFRFAWRFRASNRQAPYDPNWMSRRIDAITWIVPSLIVVSVGAHVLIYTFQLDPYRPIDAATEPLEIQVVAQDWKWLFIYPEQRIAALNEMAMPAGVPIRLSITSDTVMNSFFIPALGGQIYAMAGMRTELNLLADSAGRFVGRNTQYSGDGFADQQFAAVAMSEEDFDAWVAHATASPDRLDAAAYGEIAKPSIAEPVAYYSAVEPDLFVRIIRKYDRSGAGHAVANGH